jgi:hypothetical protein
LFYLYAYDQARFAGASDHLLERFREFRTKADEIGAFPNATSCLTLFYLVMVREHAKHERVDIAKTG